MDKFFRMYLYSVVALTLCGFILILSGSSGDGQSDIDKIIEAKRQVANTVNYPDTLVFHNMDTEVNGDKVTLTFTAENGFGVPSTYTKSIVIGR